MVQDAAPITGRHYITTVYDTLTLLRGNHSVTLGGSFLAWTLHREGSAATKLREDLDATLRPYLTEK